MRICPYSRLPCGCPTVCQEPPLRLPSKPMQGFVSGPLLYLIAGIAILAMLSGIAYKIRQAGYQAAKLECEEAAKAQRAAEAAQAAQAATGLEAKREKSRTVYKTITERVNVEVEKPVYRNVCFADDGLRIVNAALAGPSPAPAKPDAALRDANRALGRERGDGAAKDR